MAGVVNMIKRLLFVLIMVLVLTQYSCNGTGAVKAAGSSRSGDTMIDCIDIYKQPAFDNPLLKSHKLQMIKPSFIREENKLCPIGTVPIPRTLRSSSTKHEEASEPNGIDQFPPLVRHYEVLETDDFDVHYGVKGIISVNNPVVESDQLSSAQIWVQSGPPQDLNLIEAGWAVYPSFFGDNLTRLYTSWSGIIGREKKGCINYLCSGFVQVDRELYLGIKFDNISVYGGDIYVLNMEIARDQQSGNWWLTLHNVKVGYWPKELFDHLANNAAKAGFGAITGAPANSPSPQMGNGHLPDVVDLTRVGFIARMKVLDIQGKETDIPADRVRVAGEKPPCYGQNFRGYVDNNNFQITTSFGGPGGNCG